MRTVIKIGTSTLCYEGGRLNIRRVEELCKIISDMKNAGREIIIVSSGAIAMGCGKMSFPETPREFLEYPQQAARARYHPHHQ